MRVGLLTGGGDAPGLNGIIESCGKSLLGLGYELIGIRDGFEGIFNKDAITITRRSVEGLHGLAGTLLGTSNKTGTRGREEEFVRCFKELNLQGLVACGGDGTFAGLSAFRESIPLIGVPKTIDNDLAGTEITFGYDTACSVVAEAVDSLRATADAHRRIIFVEAMGRTAGWIALGGGMASYADAILLPERPYDPEALLQLIRTKKDEGQRGLVCVVSEGAHAKGETARVARTVAGSPQPERYGGVAEALARWTEEHTGWESRHVVLGHLQRSRVPTTTDRFLTLAMGVEVSGMVKDGAWGQAVTYRKGEVTRAPISDFMQPARLVSENHRWVRMAQAVGCFI